MRVLCCHVSLLCLIISIVAIFNFCLVVFYLLRSNRILQFLDTNGHFVDSDLIIQSKTFNAMVNKLKSNNNPPLIVFLNQHALKITVNWLCNTINMTNIHERVLITAVDEEVKKYFEENWPNIAVFYYPVNLLKTPFSSATSSYQLMYYLRANLALSLVKSGISFWMTQQDTLWTRNFLESETDYYDSGDFDVLFDRHGYDDGIERETINGAHWFVRANERSEALLTALIANMKWIYTADAAILTMLCHDQPPLANCAFLPYSVSSRGSWIFAQDSPSQTPPSLLQFDIGSPASKADTMKEFSAWFIDDTTGKCNHTAVVQIIEGNGLRSMREKVVHTAVKNMISDFNAGIFDYLQRIPVIGQYFTRYALIPVYFFCFWEGWE